MQRGYIKLWRKCLENSDYFAESFTRWQAWVDLLILANHRDQVALIRHIPVPVKTGQVLIAEDWLASRWHWSRGKVRRFLDHIEESGQAVQQKSRLATVLSVVNWEKYQAEVGDDGTTEASPTTSFCEDGTTEIGKTVQQTIQQKSGQVVQQTPLMTQEAGRDEVVQQEAGQVVQQKSERQPLTPSVVQQKSEKRYTNKNTIVPPDSDILRISLSSPTKRQAKEVTPEFLMTMKTLFPGVNVDVEWAHCQQWCKEHKKTASGSRLMNWLKRAKPGNGQMPIGDRRPPGGVYTRPEDLGFRG